MAIGAALSALIAAVNQLLGAGGSYEPGVAIAVTALAAGGIGLWVGAPLEDLGPSHFRWVFASGMTVIGTALMAFRSVYQAILPPAWWFIIALFVCLALPIYGIGMIPPMVLAAAEESWQGDDGVDVRTGWGPIGLVTIGAFVGAIAGLLIAGTVVLPSWNSSGGSMFAAILLFLPALFRRRAGSSTKEETLFHTVTPYGEIEVTEVRYPGERQPERRLYLNGEEESGELVRSGAPTLAYIAAAEQLLARLSPRGSRYLFLGGGAYTLPRRVLERDPTAVVTAVELDPAITRVAERFFGLTPEHAIRRIHGDGRAFLEEGEVLFDRIYIDVYGGSEALPYALTTQEAVAAVERRLDEHGIAAWNVIGSLTGGEEVRFWSVVRTISSVFPYVDLYHHLGADFPDRQNFLVVAARQQIALPDSAGTFHRWPDGRWEGEEGAVVFRDLMEPAQPELERKTADR